MSPFQMNWQHAKINLDATMGKNSNEKLAVKQWRYLAEYKLAQSYVLRNWICQEQCRRAILIGSRTCSK